MDNHDQALTCRDCGQEFTFTAQQQAEFAKRRFNLPTRCSDCHDKRDIRRRHSRGGDAKPHTAICDVCGKQAELPFEPTPGKPVYCTECFKIERAKKAGEGKKAFALRKPEKAEHSPIDDGFAQFRLDSRLHRATIEAGYVGPTPVQAATIPVAMSGRDLIGTAQTGTGKTAAFALPILQHLLSNPVDKPRTRVMVLTPTRELAEQIGDTFRALGRHTKIRTATVYGGVGMNPQEQALRTGVEVIVACPGRLLDHISRGNTDLSHVEKLVLDEADRMLDMGFLPPIKRILSHLPTERHSMLFSATFAPELEDLTREHLRDAKRIAVGLRAPAKTVEHALYPCPQHLKTALVLRLLDQVDANSVLIFTRTKHRANKIAHRIGQAGHRVTALHSNKSQNQRQTALDDFRAGRCQILVATDIAARGLDVETISHVINYDIPDTADTYIHRIGRTGRAERCGEAMTLITGEDTGMVREIEKTLSEPIERRNLKDFDYAAEPPARDEFKRNAPPPRAPQQRKAQQPKSAAAPAVDPMAFYERFAYGSSRRRGR